MASNPSRDTEERIATGGLATRLLRNADPPTDPNAGILPWPPSETAQEPEGEWLGRWAVLAMFGLTVTMAGVFLVFWLAGEPTISQPVAEDVAMTPAPTAAPAPPPPRPTREDGVGARAALSLSAGGDPTPRLTSGPTEPPQSVSTPAAPPREPVIEPAGLTLGPIEMRALLARAEVLLTAGNLAAARPLLERAALAGDATAALRLGQSYDPGHLAGAGLRPAAGNLGLAIFWYRRSQELGNGTVAFLARKLETAARAEWGPISARQPAWRP